MGLMRYTCMLLCLVTLVGIALSSLLAIMRGYCTCYLSTSSNVMVDYYNHHSTARLKPSEPDS